MIDRSAPSVLSSWARTIVDALASRGVDVEAFLAASGLSADDFRDPNARHPIAATTRLWRLAAERIGEPAFGLHASRFVRQTTFHGLGYAVLASATLRDTLERVARYSHVLSDAAELRLEPVATGERLSIVLSRDREPPAEEAIDAVTSLIVRVCRIVSDGSARLVTVTLRRAEPENTSPYARLFRCPVEFGAPVDTIVFDRDCLDRPLPMANPELARHNDDAAQRYLAETRTGTIVDRVRSLVLDRLSGGEPSPEAVARSLGVTVRSLQRRLREHETSYAEILGRARCDLACAHLREDRFSITEIAFLLGFEDTSAFARAFRRWTGTSPTEHRARSR